MQISEVILVTIALTLLIPVAVLLVECVAALFPNQLPAWGSHFAQPNIAVLVPAHNEALGIDKTLKNILPQLNTSDRLIVIADNCTDETASIARAAGATVLERQESARRGKGYALDYGLCFLKSMPPDVVVVIDADCQVQAGTIERIARLAVATLRPIQATYLLEQPQVPCPKDAISALAFTVKNLVRPQGLNRLGLPCLLTGTGMAFPWGVLCNTSLASANLVEDMQLALDLTIAGHPPLFCADARVTGILPQQQQAAKNQRKRWEHGHLQTLLTSVPQLFSKAITQKRWFLAAIALDLSVPPLSLLVMLWAIAMLAALLATGLGLSFFPALILGLEGVLMLSAILMAWAKFCRSNLPLKTLFAIPLYILWKVPVYLTFLVNPQRTWIRTERDVLDLTKP